jgi:hypothetical protein
MSVYRYCKTCGSKKIIIPFIGSYNDMTGDPNWYAIYRCPKRRWFHFFSHFDYKRFLWNEDVEELKPERPS